MSFRITARVLLQLGAELISTDFIAIYELIKNAVDARSRRVTIDVLMRVPHERWLALAERIAQGRNTARGHGSADNTTLSALRAALIEAIDGMAPNAETLRDGIDCVEIWRTLARPWSDESDLAWMNLSRMWDDANSIAVSDTGHGMSKTDLEENYLTIGTPFRLKDRAERLKDGKEAGAGRPILGEKGLGRLSSMRLGKRLYVETTKVNEAHWNILDIDWSAFERISDDFNNPVLVQSIKFKPTLGSRKPDPSISGTKIRISALTSDWDLQRIEDMAGKELSKLTDPFSQGARYPIKILYNGDTVAIPSFSKILLEHAHARIVARFTGERADNRAQSPRLVGRITYRNREKTFELSGAHLASVARGLPPGA